ncbi:MAG TPA: PLP-dependent aminotransferase family protein [Aliidongia sp.]|nr:PLP-dependent aminotransferase family protein [Aliidongia sp.]
MTIWQPDLANIPGPRYRAIAEALAADLRDGRLRPGDRLPTHRDLAWRLKVTVGTVSRAYAEAERRGLIDGEVGRGTFIREPAPPISAALPAGAAREASVINMAIAQPMPGEEAELLAATLSEISASPGIDELLRYQPHIGRPADRAAGARWLAQGGIPAEADRVVVTCGGQHSLAVTLSGLVEPGDIVATESMTYPGFKAAAQMRHLKVEGIAVDHEGILPDAFAAACRAMPIRLLYVTPNLNNPLAGILSSERRRAIAEIARRHEVLIVEDDVYGFLVDRPASFAALAPERTWHITSLSKSAAPGLRLGYILTPPDRTDKLAMAIRSSIWMAPPLLAEIATRWIEGGQAERLAAAKRRAATERQALVRAVFGNACANPASAYHFWLPLPESWRAAEFTAAALARGVAVTPGAAFAIGRVPPLNGVRICLSAPAENAEVERGLKLLAQLLAEDADPLLAVI